MTNDAAYEQNLLKLDILASLYEYVNFYLEDYYSFESAISFVYKELLNSKEVSRTSFFILML